MGSMQSRGILWSRIEDGWWEEVPLLSGHATVGRVRDFRDSSQSSWYGKGMRL